MDIQRIEANSEGMPERIQLCVGSAKAEIVPSAGMAMVSLSVEDKEYLAMPAPLPEFMKSAHTGGIPLLYPWANRLRSENYSFKGTEVDLSMIKELKRDDNDLPMHGLLLRYDGWTIETETEGDTAVVRGTINWDAHDELMSAFPFSHQLTVSWELAVQEGSVTATSTLLVESHGDDVPVVAGWHPYLAPPAATRTGLVIEGPSLARIDLGKSGVPTLDESGETDVSAPESLDGPLANRVYDDLFLAPEGGFKFTIHGDDSSVSISGGSEWHALQVYAKAGALFTCIEPMVGRTAALSDGDILEVAKPGEPVTASFTVRIDH